MSFRPITDVWILARPKVKYYGAYPCGFLERGRALLGVTLQDQVLHVCSGRIRDYPFRGLGRVDMTVDIDAKLDPDFVMDVREQLPEYPQGWPAIMVDQPYSEPDAEHYDCGAGVYPNPSQLLRLCLQHVRVGGRVGFLHYEWPRPPKSARSVALVAVTTGYGGRMRAYSVFERLAA